MVENKIVYEQKGTRSQKISGFLYVNHKIISDVFRLVHVQGKTYEFCQSLNPWGNEGYLPSEKKLDIASTMDKISTTDMQKGWYLGDKSFNGTPDDWLYLKWEANSAFVSPDKIESFVLELNLTPISRKSY